VLKTLRAKKAWDLALAPAKSVPMQVSQCCRPLLNFFAQLVRLGLGFHALDVGQFYPNFQRHGSLDAL